MLLMLASVFAFLLTAAATFGIVSGIFPIMLETGRTSFVVALLTEGWFRNGFFAILCIVWIAYSRETKLALQLLLAGAILGACTSGCMPH